MQLFMDKVDSINEDEETFIKEQVQSYIENQELREKAADEVVSLLQKLSGLQLRRTLMNPEYVSRQSEASPLQILREGPYSFVVYAGDTSATLFAADITSNRNVQIMTDYAFPERINKALSIGHLISHYGFTTSENDHGDEFYESTMVVYQAQEVLVRLLIAFAGTENARAFLEE